MGKSGEKAVFIPYSYPSREIVDGVIEKLLRGANSTDPDIWGVDFPKSKLNMEV